MATFVANCCHMAKFKCDLALSGVMSGNVFFVTTYNPNLDIKIRQKTLIFYVSGAKVGNFRQTKKPTI